MADNKVRPDCTDIEKISVFGSFGEAVMVPMMRNKYAYSYFHNAIEEVSFEAFTAPGVKLYLNYKYLPSGERTEVYPLEAGRNVFSIIVVSPDGSVKRETELKLFRAFETPKWERILEHAPWKPRDSAGELVYKGHMWLFGGYVPEMANDVWKSPDGVTWNHISNIPGKNGVDIPVTFIFNNRMYVIDVGGELYSSSDGQNWELVTDKAPWHGRRAMGGAVFNGRIWVMGGGRNSVLYNDIWSSSDGVNWVLEAEHAPWSKRQISHSLLVYNNELWLLGGGVMGPSYFPFVAYNDVWKTSDGVNWQLVTDNAPWPARIWGSTVVYKNRMWIMGGYHSEPESRHFGDVWYSSDGGEWIPFTQHASSWKRISGNIPVSIPADMWEDRHEASAMVLNDTLYFMGGMIWPLKNDVWRLRIKGLSFLTQPISEGYTDSLYVYRCFADFSESAEKAKYRLIEAPEWLHIEQDTGKVYGVPPVIDSHIIIIEAFDSKGETARQEYTLHAISLA